MKTARSLFILLFLSMIMFTTVTMVCAASTELYIDPSPVQKYPADVCTNFDVDVTVKTVTDLLGFDFNVTWDNSLITLIKVDFNTHLNTIWGSYFLGPNQTGAGYYRLAAAGIGGYSFNGTHDLVTLRFHVASGTPGQTPIHFALHKLSNSTAGSIPKTVTDGTYKMLSAAAPPVGGTWVPIDKLALLAPWIAMALMALSALGAGVYFKRRKGNR